jgi:hypothetical protein
MAAEAYPHTALNIGDMFAVKEGVAVKSRQILVYTGSTVDMGSHAGEIPEVDVMSGTYKSYQVIGVAFGTMAADYAIRQEMSVIVKGAVYAFVDVDVEAGNLLMGATDDIVETFSGDGTAQQELAVANVPIEAVTSLVETTGPTTLTRVTGTPAQDEYYLDDETGELIIGGTSIDDTDNYVLTFTTEAGRLTLYEEYIEETLDTDTHVATLSQIPDIIEYVEATAGDVTGACGIITAGTVATKEAKLDRANKTLTFFGTDAVTECKVRYKSKDRPCGRALGNFAAGEYAKVWFTGVVA